MEGAHSQDMNYEHLVNIIMVGWHKWAFLEHDRRGLTVLYDLKQEMLTAMLRVGSSCLFSTYTSRLRISPPRLICG